MVDKTNPQKEKGINGEKAHIKFSTAMVSEVTIRHMSCGVYIELVFDSILLDILEP